MSFIYKITNIVNGKLYIGKTNGSVEDRWKSHLKDSKKESLSKRPLYHAIKFYGEENFTIEQIEECSVSESSEREKYWISFFDSYHGEGYNGTIGGEGVTRIDYDLVVSVYEEVQNQTEVAKKLNIDVCSVRRILKDKKINTLTLQEVGRKYNGNAIDMYDLSGNFIKTFQSSKEAALEITGKNNGTHIMEVCKRKRKTAYGFVWRFSKPLTNNNPLTNHQ
ncbi:MAG: GIY-YIG nuclease family protein [Bacteroidia bacterium]|nr:GIY-YIG nuclease family protein [Bacteroidia bacterium]